MNDLILAFFCGFGAGLFFALLLAIRSSWAARAERKLMAKRIRYLEAELDFAADTVAKSKNSFAARLRDKLVAYADEPWYEEETEEVPPPQITGSQWMPDGSLRFLYGKGE